MFVMTLVYATVSSNLNSCSNFFVVSDIKIKVGFTNCSPHPIKRKKNIIILAKQKNPGWEWRNSSLFEKERKKNEGKKYK